MMDDLISREAAIEAIDRADYIGLKVGDVKRVIDEVIKELKKLPSAQPEPRKGHWVFSQDDEYEYCTCSECGHQNGENWMIGGEIPFCSYCGADMRGENDG